MPTLHAALFYLMNTWSVRTATVQCQLVADSREDPNSKTQAWCVLRAYPFHARCRDGHMTMGWTALLSDIQGSVGTSEPGTRRKPQRKRASAHHEGTVCMSLERHRHHAEFFPTDSAKLPGEATHCPISSSYYMLGAAKSIAGEQRNNPSREGACHQALSRAPSSETTR